MATLVHESRRIRCGSAEEAYRCACDAVAGKPGEVEPIRVGGVVVAYQATRPAPELLTADKKHWTPPAVAEWEYCW